MAQPAKPGNTSGEISMRVSATRLTMMNWIISASTNVLPATQADSLKPSFSQVLCQRSTTSAVTTTGNASTCNSVSSSTCNPASTKTTKLMSTPRKPTRVMRSLSNVGATTMPTPTAEHSTSGPKIGPICKKAMAISIGVNRPNAFMPTKLRASTTRNAPMGSAISRLEGFMPQTWNDTAVSPVLCGM